MRRSPGRRPSRRHVHGHSALAEAHCNVLVWAENKLVGEQFLRRIAPRLIGARRQVVGKTEAIFPRTIDLEDHTGIADRSAAVPAGHGGYWLALSPEWTTHEDVAPDAGKALAKARAIRSARSLYPWLV